jgi:hypothetical protein
LFSKTIMIMCLNSGTSLGRVGVGEGAWGVSDAVTLVAVCVTNAVGLGGTVEGVAVQETSKGRSNARVKKRDTKTSVMVLP